MARKYGAKWVHAGALILAAIGLWTFPHIGNKYMLFIPMIGFGIAWASMMGVPYIIAVAAIPRERYGVYMGIINMMIVIPMLIQTLSFGKVYHNFLGATPGNAIMFAGALLFIAALATLLIKTPHPDANMPMPPRGVGGH